MKKLTFDFAGMIGIIGFLLGFVSGIILTIFFKPGNVCSFISFLPLYNDYFMCPLYLGLIGILLILIAAFVWVKYK